MSEAPGNLFTYSKEDFTRDFVSFVKDLADLRKSARYSDLVRFVFRFTGGYPLAQTFISSATGELLCFKQAFENAISAFGIQIPAEISSYVVTNEDVLSLQLSLQLKLTWDNLMQGCLQAIEENIRDILPATQDVHPATLRGEDQANKLRKLILHLKPQTNAMVFFDINGNPRTAPDTILLVNMMFSKKNYLAKLQKKCIH